MLVVNGSARLASDFHQVTQAKSYTLTLRFSPKCRITTSVSCHYWFVSHSLQLKDLKAPRAPIPLYYWLGGTS